MRQLLGGEFVCSGIDWITVTQRPCEAMELLRQQAYALAAVQLSNGEFGKPWRVSGYDGFIVGDVSYGERYDGCIFQLSGPTAASHWQRAYENCTSVTRIDLQTTVRTTEDPNRVLRRHWKEIQRHDKKMRKPRQSSITIGNSQAVTVYCGAPQSDRRGRAYDKGRESKLEAFQNCVRYEQVLRNKKARSVAFHLAQSRANSAQIARRVLAFFSERGLSLRILTDALDVVASLDEPYFPKPASSAERKLLWLHNAVRPSVLHVMETFGKAPVLEALGLCDDVVL